MARASLARGLSSDVNFSVSAGSISFRRKLSSVIRKGLESLRAFFVKSLISLLFTKFHLSAILVFFNRLYSLAEQLRIRPTVTSLSAELSRPARNLALPIALGRLPA